MTLLLYTVKYFIEDLEQGEVPGVEGASADDLGVFTERFCLAIEGQIAQPYDDDYFKDIFPISWRSTAIRITLIKQPVPRATYNRFREQAEAGTLGGLWLPADLAELVFPTGSQ